MAEKERARWEDEGYGVMELRPQLAQSRKHLTSSLFFQQGSEHRDGKCHSTHVIYLMEQKTLKRKLSLPECTAGAITVRERAREREREKLSSRDGVNSYRFPSS